MGNTPIIPGIKSPQPFTLPRPSAPQPLQNQQLQDISVYRSLRLITTQLNKTPPVTNTDTSVTLTNGTVLQWVAGPEDTDAAEHEHIVTWPTPFTSTIFTVQVTTVRPNAGTEHPDDIFEYQAVSWTLNDVTIYRARRGDDNPITTSSLILGIGF